MDTYNHFKYGEWISKNLKSINNFLKASSEQDPEDVHEKISQLSGCILIAVDGKDSEFDYQGGEVLNEGEMFCFLVLQQTEAGNANSVYAAQEKCKHLTRQIIARMMIDYCAMAGGLHDLIPESFEVHGIGPMGDNFHGVALSFTVRNNLSYKLDPEIWV